MSVETKQISCPSCGNSQKNQMSPQKIDTGGFLVTCNICHGFFVLDTSRKTHSVTPKEQACLRCGNIQLREAKHCGRCGDALQESCINCGKLTSVADAFCQQCGVNIIEAIELFIQNVVSKRKHYRKRIQEDIIGEIDSLLQEASQLYKSRTITNKKNRNFLNKVRDVRSKLDPEHLRVMNIVKSFDEQGYLGYNYPKIQNEIRDNYDKILEKHYYDIVRHLEYEHNKSSCSYNIVRTGILSFIAILSIAVFDITGQILILVILPFLSILTMTSILSIIPHNRKVSKALADLVLECNEAKKALHLVIERIDLPNDAEGLSNFMKISRRRAQQFLDQEGKLKPNQYPPRISKLKKP